LIGVIASRQTTEEPEPVSARAVLAVVLCGLAVAGVFGMIMFAPAANAFATANCRSVSYTFPHTHGEGHAALNNLRAINVSCAAADSVARRFLIAGKAPEHWHASVKTVVRYIKGQANTVSEEILAHGDARVTGDIAN
jgi:hypothetical protein